MLYYMLFDREVINIFLELKNTQNIQATLEIKINTKYKMSIKKPSHLN